MNTHDMYLTTKNTKITKGNTKIYVYTFVSFVTFVTFVVMCASLEL